MSKNNINPNAFQLDQITISNLDSITIKDKLEGRSQGRRFTVSFNNIESDELLFKDIFKRVLKISKKEDNIQNLKTIFDFLENLKAIEQIAADASALKAEGNLSYKINTWIHRFFQWGSHSQNIENLKTKN